MKKTAGILFLFLFYFILKQFIIMRHFSPDVDNLLLMGVILLSAFLIAKLFNYLKLPKLTGYMVTGLIVGPNVFHFLDNSHLEQLKFFENFALAFIAITAGGELKYSRIRKIVKPVSLILFNQIFLVFFALFFLLIPLSKIFLGGLITNEQYLIGFSLLFAATALSKSPATTMGIITEMRAKGRTTEIVLAVTVLKAIIVVLIFPLIILYSKIYLIDEFQFTGQQIVNLIVNVLGSIGLGVLIGVVIILFLKYVRTEKALFLFLTGILLTELSGIFGLEILISSIITGIVVENFSKKGQELIEGIEKTSLPLYIVFFTFAGASLHLNTLKKAFVMTMLLVVLRMVFLYLSNYIAGSVLKENKIIKHYSWLGFLGQAGIAVGLANIIEKAIPGETGVIFKSILIATVVINEFLGPIFFKYLLVKAKEVNVS